VSDGVHIQFHFIIVLQTQRDVLYQVFDIYLTGLRKTTNLAIIDVRIEIWTEQYRGKG